MGYGTPDHGIGSPAAGSGREPDLHDRSDIFRGFRCRIPLRSTIRIVGDICPKLARHRPKTSSMAAIPALGWPSLAPARGQLMEGSDRCGDGRVHRRCPVGACAAGRLRSGRHAWERTAALDLIQDPNRCSARDNQRGAESRVRAKAAVDPLREYRGF
jgi:hypothetical protein